MSLKMKKSSILHAQPARPWILAALPAALAVFSSVTPASASSSPNLRSLVEDSDAILQGTLAGMEKAPGGIWHRLDIAGVLWGEQAGASVYLFAHGPGVPESVELIPGETILCGVRWLSEGKGPFHLKLIASLKRVSTTARGGLIAADGAIRSGPSTDAQLVEAIQILASTGKSAAGLSLQEIQSLLSLSRSRYDFVREEAVRQLSALPEALPEAAAIRIQGQFHEELKLGGSPAVLEAYLELVRAQKISGASDAVCELILTRDEAALVAEGVDTLSRLGSAEEIPKLLSFYPRASPAAQGRILRILARFQQQEAAALCRQALAESSHPGLQAAAVESLGELHTSESARLLGEILECPVPELRRLAVQSLSRHQTEVSASILRNALNFSLPATERQQILRGIYGIKHPMNKRKE
ncbi:MAG: HEAT repeat domain-containing protein [Planctomycetes bacterium]|nr:HEAT repeat domain-containing protein [Planctomycetota bacterium]